ncbi:unnamed protein product [Pleuronectes platessa]|uniref:Uncharacterized protein n=1 Tax=Pleuronectes platessa TaxID=8262 RepID=A0A9N7UJW4_PLEPL|nr:unnamed protein product [Pleuronectes platessa]
MKLSIDPEGYKIYQDAQLGGDQGPRTQCPIRPGNCSIPQEELDVWNILLNSEILDQQEKMDGHQQVICGSVALNPHRVRVSSPHRVRVSSPHRVRVSRPHPSKRASLRPLGRVRVSRPQPSQRASLHPLGRVRVSRPHRVRVSSPHPSQRASLHPLGRVRVSSPHPAHRASLRPLGRVRVSRPHRVRVRTHMFLSRSFLDASTSLVPDIPEKHDPEAREFKIHQRYQYNGRFSPGIKQQLIPDVLEMMNSRGSKEFVESSGFQRDTQTHQQQNQRGFERRQRLRGRKSRTIRGMFSAGWDASPPLLWDPTGLFRNTGPLCVSDPPHPEDLSPSQRHVKVEAGRQVDLHIEKHQLCRASLLDLQENSSCETLPEQKASRTHEDKSSF